MANSSYHAFQFMPNSPELKVNSIELTSNSQQYPIGPVVFYRPNNSEQQNYTTVSLETYSVVTLNGKSYLASDSKNVYVPNTRLGNIG